MSDSIDFLEAVGRDASLRRLSAEELARRLKDAGASDVLTNAVAQRDSRLLAQEFGIRAMHEPNLIEHLQEVPKPLKVPAPGEDEPEGEGEKDAAPAAQRLN